MTRRTKIVATLGPATDTDRALTDLIAAGTDLVRVRAHRRLRAHLPWEAVVLRDALGPARAVHRAGERVRTVRGVEATRLLVQLADADAAVRDAVEAGVAVRGHAALRVAFPEAAHER